MCLRETTFCKLLCAWLRVRVWVCVFVCVGVSACWCVGVFVYATAQAARVLALKQARQAAAQPRWPTRVNTQKYQRHFRARK